MYECQCKQHGYCIYNYSTCACAAGVKNYVFYQSKVCYYTNIILCRYQPTEEEKEMYKNYKGEKTLLQQADVFLMKVL